jgi:hypothetical protein
MHPTTGSGPDNDTTKSSPPDVISKSTNISQNKTKSADSSSRQVTSGPALQGRPSYAAIARGERSDKRLNSAPGANPAAASSQQSRRRGPRPTDNQTTAIPGETLRGRQAITERRDANQFDIELDARSRAGQVSPPALAWHSGLPLPLVISPVTLRYSLPLVQTTYKAFLRTPYLPLSFLIYLLQKKIEHNNVRE